jgi:hypothetical protein
MPHFRKNSTSVIARLMDQVVDEYDADLSLNPCEVGNKGCRLASGIETTFVSLTVHQLKKHLEAHGYYVNYQQIFYIPSLIAENTGGFDLSIGLFSNRSRIRTMHKVLYGIRPNRWCDESWIWHIKHTLGKNGEPSGDYRHLGELVKNHNESNGVFQPYLVLHVCTCIHEYRRMGIVYNGIKTPDFYSPLRTIVIDLREITNVFTQKEWSEVYGSIDFNLVVSKRIPDVIPDESAQDYLDRSAMPDLFEVHLGTNIVVRQIPVLTAEQLFARTVEFVRG